MLAAGRGKGLPCLCLPAAGRAGLWLLIRAEGAEPATPRKEQLRKTQESPCGIASSTATPQKHLSPGQEGQVPCPQHIPAAGWHPLPTPKPTHTPPSTAKSTSSSSQATCSGEEKLHLQDLFILRLPRRRQLAPGGKKNVGNPSCPEGKASVSPSKRRGLQAGMGEQNPRKAAKQTLSCHGREEVWES